MAEVACAAIRGELHVCASIEPKNSNPNFGVWHTIRHANSWQPFGDVTNEAAYNQKYSCRNVACANVNNELHVCVVDSGTEV